MTYDGFGKTNKRSLKQLVSDLPKQLVTLLKDELQLLKSELTAKAMHAGMGIGMFVAAGLLAFFGLAALVTTAILALCLVLMPWLAALIIGVLLFIIAGLLAFMGMRMFKKAMPPMPEQTMASVKEDIKALKGVGKYDL